MAEVFRGEFHQKVDAKGRVSIPADFRRVLEAGDPKWAPGLRPNFVIMFGEADQKYLHCFTMNSIADVESRIMELPRGTADRRRLERAVSSLSQKCEVDGEGRIVLSQRLREKLGLAEDALFAATLDTFQIWKTATYIENLDLPMTDDILALLDTKRAD